jgi:hypothetical protein
LIAESRAEQARKPEEFFDRRWEEVKDVPDAEIHDAIDEAIRHVRRQRRG